MTLGRRVTAEAVATAFLLTAIVGSGIMGENLAQGNDAIALLANTIATGAALVALILAFGPISGAHMNPLVTAAEAWCGRLAWRDVPLYIGAQVVGAYAGVAAAHGMFEKPFFFASQHARAGWPLLWSEMIAAFGLLFIVLSVSRSRPAAAPYAVGAYITAAYWFTASTSFANPAVTLGRAASDTFAGIRPDDVAGFIAVQLVGAVAALLLFRWSHGKPARGTAHVDE
jgi:glycerol uptake facilitator-like aquaporin